MKSVLSHKQKTLKELQIIPGIGKACSLDLWNLGFRSVRELKSRDPKQLYERLNAITGQTHDICMLYVFRCAVYFATETVHERKKLNWWYWKNHAYNED